MIGIAVLGGLIVVALSVDSGSAGSPPPTGRACQRLLEQQGPDLMAEADRILADRSAVSAIADCRSGAYPSAEGVTTDRAGDVVERMRAHGSVEPRSPGDCPEYLPPSECGQVWAFHSSETGRNYVVMLDPGTDSLRPSVPPTRTEFGISFDR